jgi:hypothetical protein
MKNLILFFPILVLLSSLSLQAQSLPLWKSCPVIANLPVNSGSIGPMESRRRFELRQCSDDLVIVTAYETGKAEPSLIFDTGDGYPRYMAHIFNILIFQSMGGASDHVYVFVFHQGKPALALKTATKDLIEVTQTKSAVTVAVPPTTYPDEDGKFPPTPPPKLYSFAFE